jgi:hypothetical protein
VATPKKRAAPKRAPEEPADQPPPLNGLVIPVVANEGGYSVAEVIASGDVRVTEIETLLKMALRSFRAQHGLNE